MKNIRKILSNTISIHLMVFLGLFALLGYISTDNKYLLLCMAFSFSGSVCGSFVRVLDAIKNSKAQRVGTPGLTHKK